MKKFGVMFVGLLLIVLGAFLLINGTKEEKKCTKEVKATVVDVQVKSYCVESSQWKQTCEKALALEKERRGKNVLRAVIDTLPYDPWEKTIKKLQSLYYAFAKIQANKDGYILVPPNESDLEKAGKTTCKKCGKTKDKCECEDIKLCDKVFPVDIFWSNWFIGIG